MFSRCVFCHATFHANDTLERFPTGRRVAYDPTRGRLWAVCARCRRWSLAPIEQRWEALEELERVARDRGRVRAHTANISLLRAGGVEIVRVGGDAGFHEESHWRYAREFAPRQRRAALLESAGAVLDAVATGGVVVLSVLVAGAPLDPELDPEKWLHWARSWRFGRRPWVGDLVCSACQRPLPPPRFEDRGELMLEVSSDGGRSLRRRCSMCGVDSMSGAVLDPRMGDHVLRRMLAYENYAGGTTANVSDAVELLVLAGSTEGLLAGLASKPVRLGRLPPRMSFALEMAFADERERELLALEVAELERRWREEEELAAIVDGELTEVPAAGVLLPPPL